MRRSVTERNILFLDSDNAVFSQIAEATARHLGPPKTRVYSAGVKPSKVPPHLKNLMKELGIDMNDQRAKGLKEVPINEIDLIVSFDNAVDQVVGLPTRARVERWPVDSGMQSKPNAADDLAALRDKRDAIDQRVFALFLDHWRYVA